MRVTPAPVLALPGETVRLRSASSAASSPTRHRFDSAPPPGDGGSLTVEAEGDFDAPGETARVTAEALALGSAGGSGVECGTAARQFGISLEELRALTADGTIQIGVRNSSAVEPGCPVHEHRVTLEYRRAIDRVDFGELAPGERSTRTIRLGNAGAGPLELASLATDDERVRVEASSLVIDPGATADVTLDWEPDRPGELAALLAIVSNDPDLPLVTISLTGSAALAPARAVVAPVELVAALPPRSDRTRTKSLVLTNPGGRPLDWEVEPLDGVTTVPAGGRLPAGDSVELGVRFSSRALGEGEHRRTLVLRTSDPDRPEIAVPTVLYAREVELDRMSVDFTPRHAEREGTVEVALQLPQPLDPREIRLASVTLSGVAADLLPIHYLDTDGDHVPELVLQFDRAALERYLATADELSVTVTGEVRDVTWFTGTQHLRGVADLRR